MVRVMVSKGRDITQGLRLNSKSYIRIYVAEGVHINPRTGEANSMVEVAKANIFGTANSPARPFLTDGVREKWKEIQHHIFSSMIWRFKGLKADVQFGFAANDVAHEIRLFILEGSYYKAMTPNSPTTIKEKGGDIPLLDSGQLVNHIEAEYVQS